MIRLYRPGFLARAIYRRALFRIKSRGRDLCLTFDDGPCPGSTEKIIEILKKKGVKALFFCTGIQAAAYPHLMDQIRSEGHMVGNHGYHHISGFTSGLKKYLENCLSASKFTSDTIFRPPYGRMTFRQYRELSKGYTIIMWDLMAYDFDTGLGAPNVLAVLKKKIRPGSVVVFHDKSGSSVREFLEEFITHCQMEGYNFVLPG